MIELRPNAIINVVLNVPEVGPVHLRPEDPRLSLDLAPLFVGPAGPPGPPGTDLSLTTTDW